jgi:hypothetical protein
MDTEYKILSHRADYLEMKDAEKEKRINELTEYVKSLVGGRGCVQIDSMPVILPR